MKKTQINFIELKNICAGYEGRPDVVCDFNNKFEQGKIYWLRSASGGGKSTLLKIIAGIENTKYGKYFINGQNVFDLSFEEFLPYRLNIGYSFDMGGLLSSKTVFENLMLPLVYHKILPWETAEEKVEVIMKYFGLSHFRDLRPANIPGGMRKMACVARALVVEPQILLLDEPAVGIGAENTKNLEMWLKENFLVKKDSILILGSHSSEIIQNEKFETVHMPRSKSITALIETLEAAS